MTPVCFHKFSEWGCSLLCPISMAAMRMDDFADLHHVFLELSSGVKVWAGKLRDQAALEQSDSMSLKATIESARDAVTKF